MWQKEFHIFNLLRYDYKSSIKALTLDIINGRIRIIKSEMGKLYGQGTA